MISNLESALRSILILEEIYEAKLNQQNSNNINGDDEDDENALQRILSSSSSLNHAQIENSRVFGHLAGGRSVNGGIEALLKGSLGIGKMGFSGNNSQNNNHGNLPQNFAKNNHASTTNKENAKVHWKNLDKMLLELTGAWNNQNNKNNNNTNKSSSDVKKIIADLNSGRPDRVVRIASIPEKEMLRQELNFVVESLKKEVSLKNQQDDDGQTKHDNLMINLKFVEEQQQKLSSSENTIVLGSAASSVSRAILHGLML